MFPNYFFRMPVYPIMNSPIGENAMMGLPREQQEAELGQDTPITGFGTGEPSLQFEAGPPVQDDINYLQGYLRTHIGQYVKIEFLIGTNLFIDKEGILEKVGISYVVLKEAGTGNELIADLYSIKFVTVSRNGLNANKKF
ncbi:hypothetical protein [Paramaledivibacter caminithermalis]|jgi:hypothetical protein|uniref:Spore coat protein GerQ n=1 Tax=Paramaledivibacter caminithermalis (strain DSM 15212 / CIP 107654 / DViRD3) TaxID=1121301 RepID=A0A1M6TEG4_PARC5|nr:hypothetical protein [Paramaledivibacter caminithermalis]SHK55226.1 hypothetical protein SAMN02745912_03658 [Paramaledivibacter caminithermalis DSM 15212]